MLKVNFHPESDFEDYSSAVNEFSQIWNSEGEIITSTWEKVTGLKFRETFINATLFDGKSSSHPLTLRYNTPSLIKKSTLIHELGHRILYKRVAGMKSIGTLGHHKLLYILFQDVILEMYGNDILNQVVEFESSLSEDYKNAWQWALSYSKEERYDMYKNFLKGDIGFLS